MTQMGRYRRPINSTNLKFEMLRFVLVSVFVASYCCSQCRGDDDPLDHIHFEPSRSNIREGQAYNVTCWADSLAALNKLCDGGGAERLYMQANRLNLTVHILNGSTIYHEVRSAQPKHERAFGYECLCNGKSLLSSYFRVGVRLQVDDFSCRFEEAESPATFTCSFSKPALSDVVAKANYTLQHNNQIVECQPAGKGLQMQCIGRLDIFNEVYNFTLRLHDHLDEHFQRFQLRREQMIVLERPGSNLNVTSLNSSSICLEWSAKRSTNHIGYTIEWSKQLLMLPPNGSSDSGVIWSDPEQLTNKERLCLFRLPRPYQNYTIQLKRRYAYASAHWSRTFVYSFCTHPELPARPPVVWPSGYHIDPKRPSELHIYWQQLPQVEHNGPGFTYNVTIQKARYPHEIIAARVEIESNRAIVRNLSLHSDSFTIIVLSQNSLGSSLQSSRIRIPRQQESMQARRVPKNLAIGTGESRKQLTWEPPEEQKLLTSYTVYWCSWNTTDRSECNASVALDSAEVERCTQCQYEPSAGTLIDAFNWAVSANYDARDAIGSGGIRWLAWYHGPFTTAVVKSDPKQNLQGLVALIILGGFIYFLVQKYRYMSDIKVDLPVGLQSVPALTIVEQELPLLVVDQHQRQQQQPQPQQQLEELQEEQTNFDSSVEYAAVRFECFRPPDTLKAAQPMSDYVSTLSPLFPSAPPAADLAASLDNPSGYICMQSIRPTQVTGYVSLP
ncbi:cytokine receptor [Drosophila hydei]|uniref:Cytokine receptor n=1 Tax=Drosophila hydei TaxID=7224 RepID=A0A6J1L622_DROHY|nr:cytokine receptor [Drosophila hydei]